MRRIVLAVALAATAIISPADVGRSASGYITPNPESDFENFIIFRYARDICPGVSISLWRTDDQIMDTGQYMGLDAQEVEHEVGKRSKMAHDEYKKDAAGFCRKARDLFESYDPAYLRQVGVTFGL